MATDLETLAKAFPGMTITITLEDLLKSQEIMMRRVREEERREMQREAGLLDDLIPKAEVQKKLCINPSTLWRWEKDGYLKPVKIGTKAYYRVSSVERILSEKAISE